MDNYRWKQLRQFTVSAFFTKVPRMYSEIDEVVSNISGESHETADARVAYTSRLTDSESAVMAD